MFNQEFFFRQNKEKQKINYETITSIGTQFVSDPTNKNSSISVGPMRVKGMNSVLLQLASEVRELVDCGALVLYKGKNHIAHASYFVNHLTDDIDTISGHIGVTEGYEGHGFGAALAFLRNKFLIHTVLLTIETPHVYCIEEDIASSKNGSDRINWTLDVLKSIGYKELREFDTLKDIPKQENNLNNMVYELR